MYFLLFQIITSRSNCQTQHKGWASTRHLHTLAEPFSPTVNSNFYSAISLFHIQKRLPSLNSISRKTCDLKSQRAKPVNACVTQARFVLPLQVVFERKRLHTWPYGASDNGCSDQRGFCQNKMRFLPKTSGEVSRQRATMDPLQPPLQLSFSTLQSVSAFECVCTQECLIWHFINEGMWRALFIGPGWCVHII